MLIVQIIVKFNAVTIISFTVITKTSGGPCEPLWEDELAHSRTALEPMCMARK